MNNQLLYSNLTLLIFLMDFAVIILNYYLLYKVATEQNKLSEQNVTGRACETLRLGILIPINFGVAFVNISYMFMLWGLI